MNHEANRKIRSIHTAPHARRSNISDLIIELDRIKFYHYAPKVLFYLALFVGHNRLFIYWEWGYVPALIMSAAASFTLIHLIIQPFCTHAKHRHIRRAVNICRSNPDCRTRIIETSSYPGSLRAEAEEVMLSLRE